MVPFLDHDVGDEGLVGAVTQLRAGGSDGEQLPGHHGLELALAHPVPEHDQSPRLLLGSHAELPQEAHDDVLHILDHLLVLLSLLDPDLDLVLHLSCWIHGPNHRGDARLDPLKLGRGVGHVSAEDHHRLGERLGPGVPLQHVIGARQLRVNLEAEVGDNL